MALELTREDLTDQPELRTLNLNRQIVVFKIKVSEKIAGLNTGQEFSYESSTYQIMNRESVDSDLIYVRFNCLKRG